MTHKKERRPALNVVSLKFPEPFNTVADMEDDVTAASELVDALVLICPAIEEDGNEMLAIAVRRIALTIKGHLKGIDERRGRLFEMTHPNREDPLARKNFRAGEAAS